MIWFVSKLCPKPQGFKLYKWHCMCAVYSGKSINTRSAQTITLFVWMVPSNLLLWWNSQILALSKSLVERIIPEFSD